MHVCKRRVGQHVVRGENDVSPQVRGHKKSLRPLDKKLLTPPVRNVLHSCFGINPRGGILQRSLVDIGGKQFERNIPPVPLDRLQDQHRNRIRFLAGATRAHPNPQPGIAVFADQIGDDELF